MTARELIASLQQLGEENLDKTVIMFDCTTSYTPYRTVILDDTWKGLSGKILID